MKLWFSLRLCVSAVIMAWSAAAQIPTNNLAPATVTVITDTNGNLLVPANFWTRNQSNINSVVTNGTANLVLAQLGTGNSNTFTNAALIAPRIAQFGSGTGNSTNVTVGSDNAPVMYLAGSPFSQSSNYNYADFSMWIYDGNPYSSGPAQSLRASTTNKNAAGGTGAFSTNIDGTPLYWDAGFFPSFVLTCPQAIVADMPGVTQIVNNGTDLALATVHYANGAQFIGDTVYQFYTNNPGTTNVEIMGGGQNITNANIPGNYAAIFHEPLAGFTYIPWWVGGVYYPYPYVVSNNTTHAVTTNQYQYVAAFDQVYGVAHFGAQVEVHTNLWFGDTPGGGILLGGPGGQQLTTFVGGSSYLNFAQGDPNTPILATNIEVPGANGNGFFLNTAKNDGLYVNSSLTALRGAGYDVAFLQSVGGAPAGCFAINNILTANGNGVNIGAAGNNYYNFGWIYANYGFNTIGAAVVNSLVVTNAPTLQATNAGTGITVGTTAVAGFITITNNGRLCKIPYY